MNKFSLAIIALLALAVLAPAQDEGQFDPKKAVKEIKKDLESVLEDLSTLNGEAVNPEKGKKIVDQMDELLKGMKGSQDRIINNVDQLIKNLKKSKSPSSSSSSGKPDQQQQQDPKKNQGQPQKRDRNEKPKDGERDQPQDKKGDKPKDKPTNKPDGKESKGKPEQGKQLRKAPESGKEVVPVQNDSERWGNLPAEVRQLLIEKNFRDYFPNYETEISDYLKSLNRRR